MVVGLTGRYCSGKDTASGVFMLRGWHVIDVDGLGHDALKARKQEVVDLFGPEILDDSGNIDRRRLGSVVFNHEKALLRLEAVVHPWMVEQVEAVVNAHNREKVVINAAVLFKMGLHRVCDTVIWVEAPAPIRFIRGLRRDGFRPCTVLQRIMAQRHMKAQIPRKDVDIYSIANAGSSRSMQAKIERLLNMWS